MVVEAPARVHAADVVRVRRIRGAEPPVPELRRAQAAIGVLAVAHGLSCGLALAACVVAEHSQLRALRDAVLRTEANLCHGQQKNLVLDGLGPAAVRAGLCDGQGGGEQRGQHLRAEAGQEAGLCVVRVVAVPDVGIGRGPVIAVLGLIPAGPALIEPLADVSQGIAVVAVSLPVQDAVALHSVEAADFDDALGHKGCAVGRIACVVFITDFPADGDAVILSLCVPHFRLYG